MESSVVRWSVLIVTLMQFGVASIYAPAHRLLHHTLGAVDASASSVATIEDVAATETRPSATACREGCCHHHARRLVGTEFGSVPRPLVEPPASSESCPEDEESCIWCAVALQPADSTVILAGPPVLEPIAFVSSFDHSPVAELLATPFDVRGPPVL